MRTCCGAANIVGETVGAVAVSRCNIAEQRCCVRAIDDRTYSNALVRTSAVEAPYPADVVLTSTTITTMANHDCDMIATDDFFCYSHPPVYILKCLFLC